MAKLFEYEQKGQRQALADLIANIEATSTPMSSMMPKIHRPEQKILDHQVESFPNVGHIGVKDGVDVEELDHVDRDTLYSVAQKVWWNPAVSDFAEMTKVAGVKSGSEIAHQKAIALVLVKRMIEQRCSSDIDSATQSAAGSINGNETRGSFEWIKDTAQGHLPVPSAFLTPTASIYTGNLDDFNEADLAAMADSIYNQVHAPSVLDFFVGIKLKNRVSRWSFERKPTTNYSNVVQFNQDAKSKALIRIVDTIELDSARVNIYLTDWLLRDKNTGATSDYSSRSGLLVNRDYCCLSYFRLPRQRMLEDRGGGPRVNTDAIFMNINKNPLAHGKVYTNTDS